MGGTTNIHTVFTVFQDVAYLSWSYECFVRGEKHVYIWRERKNGDVEGFPQLIRPFDTNVWLARKLHFALTGFSWTSGGLRFTSRRLGKNSPGFVSTSRWLVQLTLDKIGLNRRWLGKGKLKIIRLFIFLCTRLALSFHNIGGGSAKENWKS